MNTEKKESTLEIFVIEQDVSDNKTSNNNKKCWHIEKQMVRFKIHYFVFMGALGPSIPFLGVFAKNRIGLSATSYAAILITQLFLLIFTKTLIGYLADYFNKLKAIICILTVILTIFMFLLFAIPKISMYEAIENHNLTLLKPASDVNQNENCKLLAESILKAKVNVFCSITYSNHQKTEHECSMTVISPQSNTTAFDIDINSTTPGKQEMSFSENEHLNISHIDSLCALCCNITDNCYILSCPEHEKISEEEEAKEVSQFKTYQFWEFAVFCTVVEASLNALFTLSDTACCETVVKTGSDFGKQRLYGAVGWGTMSPLGGLLNDYTDGYLPGWIITGVMLMFCLWNIWKLDLVQPQFSQNILKDVGTVMSSKEFLTILIGVFMNGVGTGILWNYQIWFLNTIGASRLLCGLVQTVQCCGGEVPFMFISGWVIKKIGHFNVISLSLMAYCIRFLWYSYLENPWFILPMEVVSGITYGLMYPSVASYAKLSSKPGTEATTQSILFSTHEGLGAGVGCVLAGIGFDNIGGHQTFFYASIFSGCGMLLNLTFTLWNRKENKSMAVTMS